VSFDDDLEELDDLEDELTFMVENNELLEHEGAAELSDLAARYCLRLFANRETLGRFYRNRFESTEASLSEAERNGMKALGLPVPGPKQGLGRGSAFIGRAWRAARSRQSHLEGKELAPPRFRASLEAFRERLRLSDVECELLEFAVVLRSVTWFNEAASVTFGSFDERKGMDLVARAIGRRASEVAAALTSAKMIVRAGLVTWDSSGAYTLPGKLECTDELALATIRGESPTDYLARECQLAPATDLSLDDFPYLERETRVLTRLLAETSRRKTRGVNILLYGEPGTGKTELARVLAEAVAAELWEVGCRGRKHEAVPAKDRLRYLRFGQELLGSETGSLLLFDEAEDVFEDHAFPLLGPQSRLATRGKAWFNQLLETNAVPTIWLCNTTDGIDSAQLRRFLYVLELPRPPRAVRHRILERELAPAGVPGDWIARVSADERLVPGHIARAKRLVEHLGEISPAEAQDAAEQALVNTLKATGSGHRLKRGGSPLTRYRPEFLNADTDLETLTAGVASRGAGRLCFYGPPGTGKSAFARHLAEQAGKEVIYRRASDILSCWVGGTEQNIAEMFQQAEREGAAIILDEADSFLASRQGATHSWEVTHVNELLTQMEAFEGLFIASTNLMERLDAASLRRFDMKLRFRYLSSEQSKALFLQVLREHGVRLRKPDQWIVQKAASRSNLTPGDFAAVIRRARLSPARQDGAWWAEELCRECAIKADAPRRTIGF